MSGIYLSLSAYTELLSAGSDAVNSVSSSIPSLIPIYGVVISFVLLLACIAYVINLPKGLRNPALGQRFADIERKRKISQNDRDSEIIRAKRPRGMTPSDRRKYGSMYGL